MDRNASSEDFGSGVRFIAWWYRQPFSSRVLAILAVAALIGVLGYQHFAAGRDMSGILWAGAVYLAVLGLGRAVSVLVARIGDMAARYERVRFDDDPSLAFDSSFEAEEARCAASVARFVRRIVALPAILGGLAALWILWGILSAKISSMATSTAIVTGAVIIAVAMIATKR